MDKEKKPTKPKPQVRVMKADLKDMIRDELYAYKTVEFVMIPKSEVKELAKRIAKRATIGH
jgi:hypothetical protein